MSVRTALVLGGTSDIALATLAQLRAHGLERAVLASRTPPEQAPSPGGVQCTSVRWDVLDTASHEQLWQLATEQLGAVDVVLCAVGVLGHHAGLSMGAEQVDEMMRTNAAGPAAALATIAPHLAEQGSGTIVVLSSVAGVRPRRSNYVYGASKAALDAFTRGLADALHGSGVHVLVVRPGFVRSSMTEGLDPAPFASVPDDVATAVARAVVRGRSATVWVPPLLGPLFAVLGRAPAPLWRRIAGDR